MLITTYGNVQNGSTLLSDETSIENLLTILTQESFVAFFNYSALLFQYHKYNSCRQILEKLLELIVFEHQDCGVSIKICFLLIEVYLRQWNDCAIVHSEDQYTTFQNMTHHTLHVIEKYVIMLVNTNCGGSPAYAKSGLLNATTVGDEQLMFSTDINELLLSVIRYRTILYRCRINLALGIFPEADADILKAMQIFEFTLEPIIKTPTIIDLSSYTTSLVPGLRCLGYYLGGSHLSNPQDHESLRNHLSEQKKIGFNVQVTYILRFFN